MLLLVRIEDPVACSVQLVVLSHSTTVVRVTKRMDQRFLKLALDDIAHEFLNMVHKRFIDWDCLRVTTCPYAGVEYTSTTCSLDVFSLLVSANWIWQVEC